MEEPLSHEVRDLHVFFGDWLAGRLADSAFRRLERALAPDFEIVGPDGRRAVRADLLAGLRAARGSEPADPAAFWIKTEAVRARPAGEHLWIVTYEEWQRRAGRERGRLSTALLQAVEPSKELPTGLLWRHVHETWLP